MNIGIIYRNYKAKKREEELIKISKACKKNRYLLFVSNDIKLALKVKANGIYVPSFNKTRSFSNIEKKNIIVLGSAHNQKEIKKKFLKDVVQYFYLQFFMLKKKGNFLDYINLITCVLLIK